jgi:hypothetical protein
VTETSQSGLGRSGASEAKQPADERVRAAVKALRSARSVSTTQLYRAMGIGKTALFARLNGGAQFTVAELDILADLFDVPVETLITGRIDLSGPRRSKGSLYLPILDSGPTTFTVVPTPRAALDDLTHASPPSRASAA